MKKLTSLPLTKLRTDGGTQFRVFTPEQKEEQAGEYALALQAGEDLCAASPPVAFWDGRHYWLADGFIRHRAHELAGGHKHMLCEVKDGTKRDAILYAAGANSRHGLNRTPADKRNAVTLLLSDEEWGKWNNSEIARRCAVSEHLVRDVRAELSSTGAKIGTGARTVERAGTTYQMDTSGIGQATADEDLDLPPHLAARLAALPPEERAELLRLAQEEGARQEDKPPLSPSEQRKAELTLARHLLDKAKTLAKKNNRPKAVEWIGRARKDLAR